jgi:hypothetical protein
MYYSRVHLHYSKSALVLTSGGVVAVDGVGGGEGGGGPGGERTSLRHHHLSLWARHY